MKAKLNTAIEALYGARSWIAFEDSKDFKDASEAITLLESAIAENDKTTWQVAAAIYAYESDCPIRQRELLSYEDVETKKRCFIQAKAAINVIMGE